jgi:hypothetical protein
MKIGASDILGLGLGQTVADTWWAAVPDCEPNCALMSSMSSALPNPPLVRPVSPVSGSTTVTPDVMAKLTQPGAFTPEMVMGETAAAQQQATVVYQNVLAQTAGSAPSPAPKCSWYQTMNTTTGLCETGGTAVILIAAAAAMFIMVMGGKK